MSERITAPRGTTDILPDAVIRWQRLESTARQIMRCYGYQEIRTPIFEDTNLFARSLGQASDVVQKQMLNLAKNVSPSDKDSQREQGALTLRPEGTASIVRAYIEHHLARQESLSKLFYWGPMFRGERPQKGRLRQFHQVGVEVLGTQANSPYLDVEVIALAVELLKGFGLTEFKLKINSLGSTEDKEQFSTYLRERLGQHQDKLCADCQQRLERNVFRVLDCKNPSCRSVVQGLHLSRSTRWTAMPLLSPSRSALGQRWLLAIP